MNYDHIPFIIGGVLLFALAVAVWTYLDARKRRQAREAVAARVAAQTAAFWAEVAKNAGKAPARPLPVGRNRGTRPVRTSISRTPVRASDSSYHHPAFDPTPAIITAAIMSTTDTSSYSAPSYDSSPSNSFDSGSFIGGDSGSF